jgi:N-acetylglucosamine kinase-like BadF-type ATPase
MADMFCLNDVDAAAVEAQNLAARKSDLETTIQQLTKIKEDSEVLTATMGLNEQVVAYLAFVVEELNKVVPAMEQIITAINGSISSAQAFEELRKQNYLAQ